MGLFNRISIAVIASILLFFIIYKAGNTAFTHDESYTYLHYIPLNGFDIIAYKHPFPNNHILNSLAVKFFNHAFGASEASLRTPNIIAGLLYFICVFLLLKKMEKWLLVPGFILLTFNPFLLDFFSLARGYGLAIATMMGSIYCYINYLGSKKIHWFSLSLFLASLALFANFALFNYFFALVALHNFLFITNVLAVNEKPNLKKFYSHNRPFLICLLILFALLYEPVRRLTGSNFFDFGGTKGFWEDTVGSLIHNSCYDYENPWLPIFLKGFVLLIVLLTAFTWIWQIRKIKFAFFIEHQLLVTVNLVLALIILSTIFQHLLFGTQYLSDRFALFLIPLFILNAVALLNTLCKLINWKPVLYSLTVVPALVLLIHTVEHVNVSYYPLWKFDMNNKKIICVLEKQNRTVQLGISWLFEPSLNFYRQTKDLNWLNPLDREGLKSNDDFYYVTEDDLKLIPDYEKKILVSFKDNNTFLIKNK